MQYFNPRRPHGKRPSCSRYSAAVIWFQPISPSREVTAIITKFQPKIYIKLPYPSKVTLPSSYYFLSFPFSPFLFMYFFRCESPVDFMCTSHSHWVHRHLPISTKVSFWILICGTDSDCTPHGSAKHRPLRTHSAYFPNASSDIRPFTLTIRTFIPHHNIENKRSHSPLYKIKVWSAAIPLSTPTCSTFVWYLFPR